MYYSPNSHHEFMAFSSYAYLFFSVEWVYLTYLASGLEASYKSARAYLVSPPGPT